MQSKLVRQEFQPLSLSKTGIKKIYGLPFRFVGGLLPCARHELYLGPVPAAEFMQAPRSWRSCHLLTHRPRLPRRHSTELSSRICWIPCSRRMEIITLAPRSLKLPVGENHSSLNSAGSTEPRSFYERGAALSKGDRNIDSHREGGAITP